jgi:hypothetical protein
MTRTAGRVGPHRESHEESLLVTNFSAAGESNAYADWDGTHGITEWGMDNNGPDPTNPPAFPDGLGCCGGAAPDHGNMAKKDDVSLLGTLGQPKFSGMLGTYFAFGVSQGEVGQPPAPEDEPDQGVANAPWLKFLFENGILDEYAEVPLDQLDTYAPIGNGLLIGVQLDAQAQQQFENQEPWDGAPDPEMGHDVWLIKLNADGSGEVISWGANQAFTLNFRQNNITDAWLIGDNDDPTVDHDALHAAIVALGGASNNQTPPADDTPPPAPPAKGKSKIKDVLESVEHDIEEAVHDVDEEAKRLASDVSKGVFGRSNADVSNGPGPRR